MSTLAKQHNEAYLKEMLDAAEESTLGRLRLFWWNHFLQNIETMGLDAAINQLDLSMNLGNGDFVKSAVKYATSKGHAENSPAYIQALNQFTKSNTGKMFERFVGLAIAHALSITDSRYCIVPFRTDTIKLCHSREMKDFGIEVDLGKMALPSHIDSDLLAFDPEDSSADMYMISVKSTLKDRFHNVPFWNLLRKAALGDEFENVKATNSAVLGQAKYIAVCSDLAKEQPDFGAETGPRNMLCIDAALLDGAFVTASRARGLGDDSGSPLGTDRAYAFYPLNRFLEILR